MKTTNIDGIVKEFTTDSDFIEYSQKIWEENEANTESNLPTPITKQECIDYINIYTELQIL